MPRIVAASIAENRDLRQSAILRAASDIARQEGLSAVTVGAVAQQAGLARSSVYAYFNSSADLIADVLVDELHDMCAALTNALVGTETAEEAILSWVRESLAYIIDGRHALVRSTTAIELPPTRKAEIGQLHRQMLLPLIDALKQVGVAEPMRSAMQISAIIDVCVRRIESGGNLQEEITAAENFVLAGIAAS
jgi:AcrR family transcriptional regulator